MPYAMVRIAAFFIGGVLLGIYWPEILSELQASWLALVFSLLFLVFYFLPKSLRGRSTLSGIAGLCAIFILGYVNLLFHTEARQPEHIIHANSPIERYQAVVNSSVEEKEKSWRVVLSVKAIQQKKIWKAASGNVLVYISKASPVHLSYGDELIIEGTAVELTPPANPYEFDFKRFLTFRNIYHQQFVRSEQIFLLNQYHDHGFLYYSQQARAWASQKMKQFVHGEREQAIALALVLGVTDGLDNELQNAYSASGAMHVLAVSGLHVGIIYWMILLLLKPVRSLSWSAWLIAGISLVCLWAYAFVTGLSPSVLRAVAMFSFVAIAKPFARNTNIYNTLAASAFILLIYNPHLIMSVGFQLSYLAVLGIVYLQRPIYRLWEPDSKFLDWCWSISSVSIAAQIATFTLGLLYFHQFPVYFLFSNLFVIPGSFVVLLVGIILLAVSFASPLAAVVGWLLEWSIKILNWGVFAVEDLPYSLINGVYLTTFQCWLLMGAIISVILLFEFRKFRYLVCALVMILAFTFVQWQHYFQEVDKRQLIVYRVNGHGAIEWIDHGKSYFYSDSLLLNDLERIRFHIRPNRIASGVGEIHANDFSFVKTWEGVTYLNFHGTQLLWLNKKDGRLPDQAETDYLVIGNNAVRSLDQITDKIHFRKIILESSNSQYYSERIKKEAASKNMDVYAVLTEGAFHITI